MYLSRTFWNPTYFWKASSAFLHARRVSLPHAAPSSCAPRSCKRALCSHCQLSPRSEGILPLWWGPSMGPHLGAESEQYRKLKFGWHWLTIHTDTAQLVLLHVTDLSTTFHGQLLELFTLCWARFFWCSSPNICLHTYIVSTPIAHFRSWNLHLYNWCEDPEGIKDIKIQVQIREGINKNLMGYPPVTIILLYGEKKNANTACDLYFTTLRAQLTSQWLKVSCGRAKPLVFFLKSSAKPKLSTTGKWASMLKICEPSRISPATTLPNLFPNTAYNLPEIKNQC